MLIKLCYKYVIIHFFIFILKKLKFLLKNGLSISIIHVLSSNLELGLGISNYQIHLEKFELVRYIL